MARKKKRKNKIKRDMATGCPIINEYNEDCPFCIVPKDFKTRMFECVNPYLLYSVSETHNVIIRCPKRKKDCDYYVEMKKHIKDLELVKRYIKKFEVERFIAFKKKHLKWFLKRVAIKSPAYVRKLFSYFGYSVTKDSRIEAQWLFTNYYEGMQTNIDDDWESSREAVELEILKRKNRKKERRAEKRKQKKQNELYKKFEV